MTFKGIVIKAAPEQLRHASPDEQLTLSGWIDDIAETRKEMEKKVTHGYIDLSKEELPGEDDSPDYDFVDAEDFKPTRRITGKQDVRKLEAQEQQTGVPEVPVSSEGVDYWQFLESIPAVRRVHVQARLQLYHPSEHEEDCPVGLESLSGQRTTILTRVTDGLIRELNDVFTEAVAEELTCMDGQAWTGYTQFEVLEESDDRPSVHLGMAGSGFQRRATDSEEQAPMEEAVPYSDPADDMEEQILRSGEHQSPPAEDKRAFEAVDGDSEDDHRPAKRSRVEFMEILHQAIDKALEATKKKEIVFRQLTGDYREKFWNAMQKEIQNNIDTGAYEPMSMEESEAVRRDMPEKILQSRYVLVEKPIEPCDVEKAKKLSTKAKARHVMKGFSEWDAEGLDASTPQVARESVTFILQILSSSRWTPGYLGFTQAFHSGDQIQRTLFAEQPLEGIPGMKPRQMLRLKKCCYGLLDGPYQWYVHLRRLLTEELKYEISQADPCVFYLFGPERQLLGIISVATDDLLHGGTDEHWQRMNSIQSKYRLGKFAKGDGRFAGKEVKHDPASGVIRLCQPLYTSEKVKLLVLTKERRQEKMSYCTEVEITALRGLLGSLAWLAKETRPDLCGRVALLQQCMPRPFVQDMLDANSVAKEAIRDPELGIQFYPIPFHLLRVGTVTDASWGNSRQEYLEEGTMDFWEETKDSWIRHHRQP